MMRRLERMSLIVLDDWACLGLTPRRHAISSNSRRQNTPRLDGHASQAPVECWHDIIAAQQSPTRSSTDSSTILPNRTDRGIHEKTPLTSGQQRKRGPVMPTQRSMPAPPRGSRLIAKARCSERGRDEGACHTTDAWISAVEDNERSVPVYLEAVTTEMKPTTTKGPKTGATRSAGSLCRDD